MTTPNLDPIPTAALELELLDRSIARHQAEIGRLSLQLGGMINRQLRRHAVRRALVKRLAATELASASHVPSTASATEGPS